MNRIFNKSKIVWLTKDGLQPVDEVDDSSICLLEDFAQLLHVECELAIVVANILGFGIFASFLILFFFFFKRRYERKVRQTEERMRALGLLSSGTLLTLDEWEIPRERIVINRKLGEGAFGTVYGGEAFFDDKGWVSSSSANFLSTVTCAPSKSPDVTAADAQSRASTRPAYSLTVLSQNSRL